MAGLRSGEGRILAVRAKVGQDPFAHRVGDHFAIVAAPGDPRLEEDDADIDAAGSEKPMEVGEEFHVAMKGECIAHRGVGRLSIDGEEIDAGGMDGALGEQGRFDERTLEGEDAPAVRRCPFGKQYDREAGG